MKKEDDRMRIYSEMKLRMSENISVFAQDAGKRIKAAQLYFPYKEIM